MFMDFVLFLNDGRPNLQLCCSKVVRACRHFVWGVHLAVSAIMAEVPYSFRISRFKIFVKLPRMLPVLIFVFKISLLLHFQDYSYSTALHTAVAPKSKRTETFLAVR